jgi:hypothetical protein
MVSDCKNKSNTDCKTNCKYTSGPKRRFCRTRKNNTRKNKVRKYNKSQRAEKAVNRQLESKINMEQAKKIVLALLGSSNYK